MAPARIRQMRVHVNSDKKTTAALFQELRKLQERGQAVEASQTEFQKRMQEMENDLEQMAATVDPDLGVI